MAKQTGPSRAVKKKEYGARRLIGLAGALLCAMAVSSCASTWHHPKKNAEEAAADEKACAQRAEENALARAGRQRADYRLGTPSPYPGMSRGESPMELHDRRATQDDYTSDFEDCMTSKGYSRE